jgi:CO/xanthine dehydrogenase FAD-binding subunit
MAYDAVVVLRSTRGVEEVPLADFYLGYKSMRRTPEQLVTAIRLPRRSYAYQRFEKVGPRRAQAITKVGLAVTCRDGEWRVVANSVAPTVRRCRSVERLLADRGPVRAPEDFLPALREDVSPIDDVRSTAEYRLRVLARLLYFDLRGVCASVR